MHEVVQGGKQPEKICNLKSCKAKISSMWGVEDNDLCVAICRVSQVVFVTSNNFTHNLFFLFLIVLGALVNKSAYV